MTIEYREDHVSTTNDGYSQVLREAQDFFASRRIQILGKGFEEVLSEGVLFNEYCEKLCEGLDATEAEEMAQLFQNSRNNLLRESGIAGVEPIAGLNMPTIRKMWPRIGLKNALPTEPVKKPKFVISYLEPYLERADGTQVPLPKALRDFDNTVAEKVRLDAAPITLPVEEKDLLAPVGASIAVGDAIDPKFSIAQVIVEVKDNAGANPEKVTVPVQFKLALNNTIYGEVVAKHSDGTVNRDTLFAGVDLAKGLFTARSLKDTVKEVVVKGWLSSENNSKTDSIGFDIKTKDVTIGTGTHLNASLPLEWLQDTMALYNIDAALEIIDTMSSTIAQKLEQEILNFIDNSFEAANLPYRASFDLRPSAAYAGRPKDWREEIKTVIDHVAQRMKNDSNFSGGKFVLIGNPIDMIIIPNTDWVFNHVTDTRGGVDVEFNLGSFSGTNLYELVASTNVRPGQIRMIYIPANNKQMTYKYYPYSFNVERGTGYRDPNRPNIPSLMMTKRHTIEEFTPLAAVIDIENNDGRLPK